MSAPFTNPQGLQPGLVYYTPLESGKPSGPTQTYGMGGGGPYGQPGPPPPGTGYNPIPNPAYSPDASYWEAVYGMSKAEWLAAGQPPKPANSQPYYLPGTGGMPGTAPKNIIPLAPGDTFNVNKPSTGYGAALPATQNPGDNMPYPGSAGPSDPQNPGYTQGPGSVAPPPVIPSSGNGGGGSSGGGSFQGGSGSPDLFGDAYLYDEDPASAVGLALENFGSGGGVRDINNPWYRYIQSNITPGITDLFGIMGGADKGGFADFVNAYLQNPSTFADIANLFNSAGASSGLGPGGIAGAGAGDKLAEVLRTLSSPQATTSFLNSLLGTMGTTGMNDITSLLVGNSIAQSGADYGKAFAQGTTGDGSFYDYLLQNGVLDGLF